MVRVGLALCESTGKAGLEAKRFCMGRALSRVDPGFTGDDVRFPTGKAPMVAGDCVLSLSHSASWLLCTAARPCRSDSIIVCGVDLERNRSRVFDRIGHVLGWPSQSESAMHFYRRWTLMESLYKAIGAEWRDLFGLFDHVTKDDVRRFELNSNGWRWQVWWPALVAGSTVCVVSGVTH